MDVRTAHDHAQHPDVVLLDVRQPNEWEAGHAVGAAHLPLAQVPHAEFETGTHYLVICRSGARSAQAVAFMNNSGIQATNVDGGMNDWMAAGLPAESETGQPPEVVAPL